MSDKTEKLLKPLRDIYQKIVNQPNECTQHIKDLQNFALKGAFFEHFVFVEALETLTVNPKLPPNSVNDVFKLIENLLNDRVHNKDSIITSFYNFISKNKHRLDLFDHLVAICSFEIDPLLHTKTEILFIISELLLRESKTCEHRQALYKKFLNYLNNYSENEDLGLKILESIRRISIYFIYEKKWDVVLKLLKGSLVKAASAGTLVIKSDKMLDEILNLLLALIKSSHGKTKVFEVCCNLTRQLSKILTEKTHKRCNDILTTIFKMAHAGKFTCGEITKLNKIYNDNKPETQCILLEKTTLMVGKLVENHFHLLEISSMFFDTFHLFAVSLFRVFRLIRNKEGVISCCNDIKRHASHSLAVILVQLATKIVNTGKLEELSGKNLVYHVKYAADLVFDIKCQFKHKLMLLTYERIYMVLYEIIAKETLTDDIFLQSAKCSDVMMKLWSDLPEKVRTSTMDPSPLVMKLYYNPATSKELAEICGKGIASFLKQEDLAVYLESSKEAKKKLMKIMFDLRKSSNVLDYDSATEFLQKQQFTNNRDSTAILALIEITAVNRYKPNESSEATTKLFSLICRLTKCPVTIAQACQSVSDEEIKKMSVDSIKKVNKLLEEEEKKQFNFDVSLALALNNYHIFFVMSENIENGMKASREKSIDKLSLKEELDSVKFLNDSLRYFTDIMVHLMKHKEEMDKIISTKRLIGIINNMALQFYTRGIKYKDLEAFTLLWHFSLLEGQQVIPILTVANFFLDNFVLLTDSSGNYIKFSKKIKPLSIQEILAGTNALIDENFITDLKEETETTQGSVWSYLLSLWVHYLKQGRQAEGYKRWNQFKKSWKSKEISKEISIRGVIEAKMYFCLTEVSMKCYHRSADNFQSRGISVLIGAKTINRDFLYIYYQIYNQIALNVINYSLNRLGDMHHYNGLMASIISSAVKRGQCLKLTNLLSLAIMRNLSMEKVDNAKVQLKELTMLVGLKEDIFVESPVKTELSAATSHRELFTDQFRKVNYTQDSPFELEHSMVYQEQSVQLNEQLKSFIHKESCNCDICKVPHLKFTMFQIGCHYSRLLWLMDKHEASQKFNEHAIDPWRNTCDKLRRLKDCEFLTVNKIDFAVFSIRWLFQVADTMVTLQLFEDVEDIYQEIELICTNNIPDYNCFKEILHVRKENLNFLLENGSIQLKIQPEPELSFSEFLKNKGIDEKYFATPEPVETNPKKQRKPTVEASKVIYIDSDSDDSTVQPNQSKPRKFRSK